MRKRENDERNANEVLKAIQSQTKDYEMIVQHYMETDKRSELQNVIKRIANRFDAEVLEPSRKIWYEVQEKAKKKP